MSSINPNDNGLFFTDANFHLFNDDDQPGYSNGDTLTSNSIRSESPNLNEPYQLSPGVSIPPQFATPISKLTFDNLPITPDISGRLDCDISDGRQNQCDQHNDMTTLFVNKILTDSDKISILNQRKNKILPLTQPLRSFSLKISSPRIISPQRHPLTETTNVSQDLDSVFGDSFNAKKRKIGPVKNLFSKLAIRENLKSDFDPDVFYAESMPDFSTRKQSDNPLRVSRIYSVPSFSNDLITAFPKPKVNSNIGLASKSADSIENQQLIGDLSRPYSFPLLSKKSEGLVYISDETLAHVLGHPVEYPEFIVVDCRFPYEFNGGHIDGSLNIFSKDDLLNHFIKCPSLIFKNRDLKTSAPILIFHCEFSSRRAPRMAKYLRNTDRNIHKSCYPKLYYPEIYVLEGGYKQFFTNYKDLCSPQNYVTMEDERFLNDCNYFTKQSKAENDNQNPTAKVGIGKK